MARTTHVINFDNFTEESRRALSVVIQQHPTISRFQGVYPVANSPGFNQVLLTDTVIKYRTSKENLPRLGRYDTNALLGRGAFGSVYVVAGAMPLNDAGEITEYKPKEGSLKQRAIKEQKRKNRQGSPIDLTREIKLTPTSLKMTNAIITSNEDFAILLKRIPGDELFKLVSEDYDPTQSFKFTTKQKIEIMGRLLEQLYSTHREGIIHRDVKVENIMVDIKSSPIKASLIDFGLSKAGTEARKAGGTPQYAAPEMWKEDTTSYPADVFALARTIGLYWGDSTFLSPAHNTLAAFQKVNINPVFDNLEEPNRELKIALQQLLQNMTKENPAERFTLVQAQAAFLNLLALPAVKAEGISAADFSFPDQAQQIIDKEVQSCFELIHLINLRYATDTTPELNEYLRHMKIKVNNQSDVVVLTQFKDELSQRLNDYEQKESCHRQLLQLSSFFHGSNLSPVLVQKQRQVDCMTKDELNDLSAQLTATIECCNKLRALPSINPMRLYQNDKLLNDYITEQTQALADCKLNIADVGNILTDINSVSKSVNSIDAQAVNQVIDGLLGMSHNFQKKAVAKAREIEAALYQTPLKARATMLEPGKLTRVKDKLNIQRYGMFKLPGADTESMKKAMGIKSELESRLPIDNASQKVTIGPK